MVFLIPGTYISIGVVFYAMFQHVSVGISSPRKLSYLIFSTSCLLVILFGFSHIQALQSNNTESFLFWTKLEIFFILFFLVLITWFVALFTQNINLPILYGSTLFFAIFGIVNLVLPYSIQYEHFVNIYRITLPWGEHITSGFGRPGALSYAVSIAAFITIIYASSLAAIAYWHKKRPYHLLLLVAFLLLVLNAIVGILSRLGIIQNLEMGAFGFLVMVIAMGIALASSSKTELHESEIRFRTLFQMAPIGISLSQDGITTDVNEALLKMYGYESVNDIRGTPLLSRIAMQCRDEMEERIYRRINNLDTESNYETIGLRKDGTEFPLFISASRLTMKDGPVSIAYLIDFTERRNNEQKIKHLAYYDQLTYLPNRLLLDERLREALFRVECAGQQGAILLIDMDNFKSINDTLGHAAGDEFLKKISERISTNVNKNNFIARLGGDEFVIVIENLSGITPDAITQTEAVGCHIINILSKPFHLLGQEIRSSCSIGATLFNSDTPSLEELLKQADIAMYEAKKDYHSSLRFFDQEMHNLVSKNARVERELYKAIENAQFKLYYQKQVDENHQPVGAEALIRWAHPHRGLMLPHEFIPLSEKTGQIIAIGRWVIDAACAQLHHWQHDEQMHDLVLAINVCASQFHQTDFIENIEKALQRHEVNPKRLKLELTESILLNDIYSTISSMMKLKRLGIQLSLDDFGTGYSSLKYLQQLPLDQLKIDKSFVKDIANDESAHLIVETIFSMAKSLGLKVIAEGVETEEQMRILQAMGCTQFQGYLIGKPAPTL